MYVLWSSFKLVAAVGLYKDFESETKKMGKVRVPH